MKEKYNCHKISGGVASGKAMISREPICFYLTEPKTGEVKEDYHDLEGKTVKDKVVIFPAGKGSSVVQADGLYQLMEHDNAPKAMIVKNPDTVLVATSIIMNIPLVNKLRDRFYNEVKDNKQITVDADKEWVTMGAKE